jgi:CRP-like cAMP-binding protein
MNSLKAIFTETLGLQPEYFEEFYKELHHKKLKKKEFLIQEGAVCDFIAIVISGTMRSYVQNKDGEFNNDFYLENYFVSAYTSFLTQMPTNCNIEALTDVELYYISHKQFQALLDKDNNFLKVAKYISDNYFIRKCKRETSFLKNSAAERLEMIRKLYPGIEQKVPQYHIASYLGIKPESLSRIKLLTYINK